MTRSFGAGGPLSHRHSPSAGRPTVLERAFERFEQEEVEQSVPGRFEQQVRQYPQRIAVKTAKRQITYEALNRAANCIAHTLLDRQGEGQEPVALLLPHDVEMVAAILGVLKAAKIYVPLDAAFPPVRNAVALEDSGAQLIVTGGELLTQARVLARGQQDVLDLDEVDLARPSDNPALAISPDALAYILYTSGSTGEPKGVVENHRNVLHYTMNFTNVWRVVVEDRILLFASYSFSGCVGPLYGALLKGAMLYPVHPAECQASELADRLIRERITIANGGAALRTLVESLQGDIQFPDLRAINSGASALHASTVERMRKHLPPHAIIVNGLSMTEMKAICRYLIDRDTVVEPGLVPVGYPYDDVEILLLDEDGRPVGPLEVGEITVKSRYLAPGFWRRPELTGATFLPDPNGGEDRLYRMGDLGRRLPDGCLFILGRKDSQVKVRGYRVELGEVEAALLSLDGIREVAVLGRTDGHGDIRLVAYLAPDREPAPTVEWLRSSLLERLPDYMVPAGFVIMSALPRGATGKIDRGALPDLDQTRPRLAQVFTPPRTNVEHAIARIWGDVLGLEQVGVDDEFLALGGDSLLATRIASRVEDRFQVSLPLHSLIQANTVSRMAAAIVDSRVDVVDPTEIAQLLAQVEAIPEDEAGARSADRP
jgi:amino acid adenylation domain-containing protein